MSFLMGGMLKLIFFLFLRVLVAELLPFIYVHRGGGHAGKNHNQAKIQ